LSAFVVGKPHLDYILSFGLLDAAHNPLSWLAPLKAGCGREAAPDFNSDFQLRRRQLTRDTADAVGHMLLEENIRGVNDRYSMEGEPEGMYAFEPTSRKLDPVQLLKALQCYEYQACESRGWDDSEARVFCDALRRRAIGRLPGYEQAAWEVR